MNLKMWRKAVEWRVVSELATPLLRLWPTQWHEARVDCFEQGMLETLEFK